MNLTNKRILLFAPSFFGYEKSIQSRLKEMGAAVDFFDERPSNNLLVKLLIRFKRRSVEFIINRYYHKVLTVILDERYDYVIVINIEAMPYDFLTKLRAINIKAKFILYMWDSIAYKPKIPQYVTIFDSVFSFDKDDCKMYSNMKFRPLFFLNEYADIADKRDYTYDVSFVGTAHTDRFSIIQKLLAMLTARGMSVYTYFYMQNRRVYLLYKFTNPKFKESKMKNFHYRALSHETILEIIASSRIVIDIQGPNQKGLTIRTIEMLGAKRKLITTNQQIKEYDFYNPSNILVIDRENPQIPQDFLDTDYTPIDKNIYNKYSIDTWIEEITQ
ncbi:MAG: hypothetical protein LBO06_01390 [Bacteroidales bacterium]|jgi:hypothetical protein|nr:hypothetical protein [Bacteroidales bacterium]